MKALLPLSIIPLLLSWLDLMGAVRLEIHGKSFRRENNAVEKRSNIYTGNGTGILKNSDDIIYYSSLSLGGKNFDVLIDTGQSLHTSPSVHVPSLLTGLLLSGYRKVNPTFEWRVR